ncbi:mitochondrial genome maintenance protein mgm101 [Colletotrichum phormii]|uniref:Mitochondrial genome maintenance protein MGM101 n=1 Tax=Colletotrichum phormii TaxID=359342 RepID=A0AAJ0EA21_9PEZI|nr:mitochondrial genome maintenance protein mgm101 [Colletotrichum phormii]KAK1624629.1 mitochondrial genome maintenance protein mgm101 [Colletotrichum phormii]
MSKQESDAAKKSSTEDDEPDDWDKRIFSTGCADENAKLTDCYFEKKDWRQCTAEAADQAQQQQPIDWSTSYHGLGTARFPKEVVDILLQPVNPADVEVKPDGIVYLPEIKYRRILNQAFGPGGWGLVPKGDVVVGEKVVTREYALIAEGRFISQAQGENGYFSVETLPSAVEGCKSNALMRCCKDLGVASDLWDPVFIRQFRKEYADEIWAEHVTTKRKKLVWTRKDVPLAYPYKKTN